MVHSCWDNGGVYALFDDNGDIPGHCLYHILMLVSSPVTSPLPQGGQCMKPKRAVVLVMLLVLVVARRALVAP